MNTSLHRNEGLDFKRLGLYFKKRIWIVLLVAILGGGLGALTYQVVKSIKMPVEYQAVSKMYIMFNSDENGDVYQYYNGYTWNDLIDSDTIINCILVFLPGYDEEEVRKATEATIISDIRLLTITVTGDNEKSVREIQSAVESGLIAYSVVAEELKSVTTVRTIPPYRVYWEDRTTNSFILGSTILGIITFVIYFFGFIVDDSIYVQSDLEKRYDIKALGIMPRSQKGLQPYMQELKANLYYEAKEAKRLIFIDIDDHCDLRAMDFEKMLNWQEGGVLDGDDSNVGDLVWHVRDEDEDDELIEVEKEKEWAIISYNSENINSAACENIRKSGGVIILVPFGSAAAARKLERVVTILNNQELKIKGIIISEADEEYLMRYYS